MKQFLTALALILLCACSQNSPAAFKGYYSFKTGGSLVFTGTVTDIKGRRDTTFYRYLVPESGQMHVLKDKGDKMIVTMNVTGGDPVVFNASISGGVLTLEPVLRSVQVRPVLGNEAVRSDFTVSGEGRKYDNMILFDLNYEGSFPIVGFMGKVSSSDIHCIATENE